MKIDLHKAYDMVSCEFLEEALKSFDFLDRFIMFLWIMICALTTKFSVKVFGASYGYFAGRENLSKDTISFAICTC